jgi:hypothetical protein
VCPYVRIAGDPGTWFAFPCEANLCHAASAAGAAASGLGRLIPGRVAGRGPQPIPPETQERLCLTPAHVTCDRYVGAGAGTSTGRSRASIGLAASTASIPNEAVRSDDGDIQGGGRPAALPSEEVVRRHRGSGR